MTAVSPSAQLTWPGRTNEEWRRSSVDRFGLETRTPAAPAKSVSPKALPRDPAFSGRLVFENGTLTGADLEPSLKAKGVVFGPLADAPALVQEHLAQGKALADTLASSGHYGRVEFGAVLSVPAGVIVEAPFLVEITEHRSNVITTPHLAVSVGRAAQAALVVRHRSADQKFTVDSATSVFLADGAVFSLSELQTHGMGAAVLDHSFATLGRDAQFFHWCAPVGAAVVKTRFDFTLAGEGASVKTHGLYFGVEDQHKDLRISLTHAAPHATSYALYKGAVRDRARTVFQGLIEVNPTASQTDAYLSNKNLILNDGARADSLPQLKIDTNDVKCSHGSTTGKVNEEEVYYLTARGFTKEEARLLIAQGLFAELIDEAPAFLRDEVETLVSCALGADAHLGVCQDAE